MDLRSVLRRESGAEAKLEENRSKNKEPEGSAWGQANLGILLFSFERP
jgi:hypothetical protein